MFVGTAEKYILDELICVRMAPACNRPGWRSRLGETAYGAPTSFQVSSQQQCQQYCVNTASCVGVDLDFTVVPMLCWPHTEPGAYRSNNIYSQPRTNTFQLLTRCLQATTVQTTGRPAVTS